MDSGGGSSENQGHSSNPNARKSHRHTSFQTEKLEEYFKKCQHPNHIERIQLGNEIGLDNLQVKFWFQNRRTQMKTQIDRSSNSALRAENEMIISENEEMKEALQMALCADCGGLPNRDVEERKTHLEELQLENARLKQERNRVAELLVGLIGKALPPIETLMNGTITGEPSSSTQQIQEPTVETINSAFPDLRLQNEGMDKTVMAETAACAFDELIRLLQLDEPLWTRSSSVGGQATLHPDAYSSMLLPRVDFLGGSAISRAARHESSKHSGVVAFNALYLVNMLMDSAKWADMFPTIVSEARTIEVIRTGALSSKHDALHMMNGKMHGFSPLVPAREFNFLRHCKHVRDGMWIVVDISVDCPTDTNSPTTCWRLPSGCMIQDLPDGSSKVTWVEHVLVDDKNELHKLFRGLVRKNSAITFGAERWITALQRMSQRYANTFNLTDTLPILELDGAVITAGGKRDIMKLCHRMVKQFSEMLEMPGKLDFPIMSEDNCSGIRLCLRKAMEVGVPRGFIVTASATLKLPIPPQAVFDYFTDDNLRPQWDILCDGRHGIELLKIPTGDNPGNFISLKKPIVPTHPHLLVIQETCVDASGSMLVYAPIDTQGLGNILRTETDPSLLPILSSGVVITGDGGAAYSSDSASSSSSSAPAGSLLTVAFQIFSSIDVVDMESISNVNAFTSSTMQKLRVCFNCEHLD